MTQVENTPNPQPLTSLVADLTRLLEGFLVALQNESAALKKNDSTQLTAVLVSKQTLSEEIELLTPKLESGLKAHNLSLKTLAELQADATPSKSSKLAKLPEALQHDLQALAIISEQCQDLNQANGMAIQMLNNINQHALNLISGKSDPKVQLYGASGATTATSNTKTSLGKA